MYLIIGIFDFFLPKWPHVGPRLAQGNVVVRASGTTDILLVWWKTKFKLWNSTLEQNNVEISWIPVTQVENVKKFVMDVRTALGIDVEEQDTEFRRTTA